MVCSVAVPLTAPLMSTMTPSICAATQSVTRVVVVLQKSGMEAGLGSGSQPGAAAVTVAEVLGRAAIRNTVATSLTGLTVTNVHNRNPSLTGAPLAQPGTAATAADGIDPV